MDNRTGCHGVDLNRNWRFQWGGGEFLDNTAYVYIDIALNMLLLSGMMAGTVRLEKLHDMGSNSNDSRLGNHLGFN